LASRGLSLLAIAFWAGYSPVCGVNPAHNVREPLTPPSMTNGQCTQRPRKRTALINAPPANQNRVPGIASEASPTTDAAAKPGFRGPAVIVRPGLPF